MKRVSFKVAKAIKEAGYPQGDGRYYAEDGLIVIKDKGTKFLCRYYIPSYLEVWLWLWREKKIEVIMSCGTCVIYHHGILQHHFAHSDPEEAIIAAIEYLVNENLLK